MMWIKIELKTDKRYFKLRKIRMQIYWRLKTDVRKYRNCVKLSVNKFQNNPPVNLIDF